MFSGDKIPQPFANLVGALFRFIAGAFGQDLQRPMTVNFCPYFWAVFFTFVVPVALPVVLLGWTLRLTLGKGRGAAVMYALSSASSAFFGFVIVKWITAIVLFAVALSALGFLFWYLFEEGLIIRTLIIVGVCIVVILGSVAILVVAVITGDAIVAKRRRNATVRKPNKILRIGWTILWPVRKILFFVFAFFMMIAIAVNWGIIQPVRRGYKASCPIVDFE